MLLFNSKTNKLETFVPINENEVRMYVCGPTVYNHAHIGNARPIVVFDLLRRVLVEHGYQVHYVSNFTDIDDKIVNRAKEENKTEKMVSEEYIDAYNLIRKDLHANFIDACPKVTDNIAMIIEFIDELIKANVAYNVDGNVYFRVEKVEGYGQISNQDLEALQVGARIEKNQEKENPLDFVLWKKTKEGISWEAPWGNGRPGWHTECVVMIHNEFGDKTIDIHGGGQDLKFPHHENESAQNRALHHHDLANYWVHNAMLNIDNEKMSKSLGNVHWAKDFIEEFGANITRWVLLSTHYRLTLNITDQLIQQSLKEVGRIESALNKAGIELQRRGVTDDSYDVEYFNKFMSALYDDLNVANAQKELFEVLKTLNQAIRQKDVAAMSVDYQTLLKMIDVLGLSFDLIQITTKDIEHLNLWDQLKKDKNFEEADKVRDILTKRGII
ncbi:cysteine--tRNA ligase [Erysipelothrix urinaevulpis]|uniref:cysteine--tRNA ligase n=1 Tax=Erysipelothrix urinaevulpis TaxID=2683717 RepID=UPI001358DC44|nr:cysteine--tRNA ligase [Erysipelothrix urinaevulpis]